MSIQDGGLIKGQKNAHHHTSIPSTYSVDITPDPPIFSLVTTFKKYFISRIIPSPFQQFASLRLFCRVFCKKVPQLSSYTPVIRFIYLSGFILHGSGFVATGKHIFCRKYL
jgi:hypothetical protein